MTKSEPTPFLLALLEDKQWPKQLDKHATDLGYVAIAWASLHDTLGLFFSMLFSPFGPAPVIEETAIAAWGALKSDRSQREMLEATAKQRLSEDSTARKELLWALGQINRLDNDRNNALHASYSLEFDDGAFKVVPSPFAGNPRSSALRDRDLSTELQSYVGNIQAIDQFVCDVLVFLAKGQPPPSPQRPRLPRPSHKTSQKKDRKSGKLPPPPTPSSPA